MLLRRLVAGFHGTESTPLGVGVAEELHKNIQQVQ
jgi:hypothetical protein